MNFLFESPFLTMALALGAGLAALWIARSTGRHSVAALALFFFAISLAAPLLDWLVVTPREEIGALLDRLTSAALRSDAETIVAAIAPDFKENDLTRASLERSIRDEIGRCHFESVRLNGRQIEADSTNATARFVAVISATCGSQSAPRYPIRLRLTFAKREGLWKITGIRRYEPAVNTDREIPLTAGS